MGFLGNIWDDVKSAASAVSDFIESFDPYQHGGSGNDRMKAYNLYVYMNGHGGDDVMHSIAGWADVYGGSGNDYIRAIGGDNDLFGGSGNDVIYGYGGSNYVEGGTGSDYVKVVGGTNKVYGGDGHDDIHAYGLTNYIVGGDGDDRITAYAADNALHGGSGHDRIKAIAFGNYIDAGTGNDTVDALAASNTVYLRSGHDYAQLEGGRNKAYGESGNDTINAYGLTNYIDGGSGDDFITAWAADNALHGGSGDDTIRAFAAGNYIDAGDDDDEVEVKGISNKVYLGKGNDEVDAKGGLNNVYGGSGHDTITADGGSNKIYGESGHDEIDADGGLNYIHAGSGTNKIRARGIKNTVRADGGSDWLKAYAAENDINLGNGNNRAYLLAGKNKFVSGTGNDHIEADGLYNDIHTGSGDDYIKTLGAYNKIRAMGGDNDVYAGGAYNEIDTGVGADKVRAVAFGNDISTSYGDDTVEAIAGGNVIDTSASNNSYYNTQSDRDHVTALGGGNTVRTGFDDDHIEVAGIGNEVEAGTGNDTIRAIGGVNLIDAGNGHNDVLSIAGYADILAGSGNDTITAMALVNDVDAGDGHNRIITGGAVNNVDVGTGNDTVIAAGIYNDVDAGTGNNRAVLAGAVNRYSGGGHRDEVVTAGLVNFVSSSGGNDTVIAAGAYNDIDLRGNAGDIVIAGGLYNNINAHDGNNTIISAGGVNVATAGSGNDVMLGVGGVNKFEAGEGNNTLVGLGRVNYLRARNGDDVMVGAGLVNIILAGSGDNALAAVGGVNVIKAGTGDDVAVAAGLVNTLQLNGGDNIAVAVGGVNVVTTKEGDDIAVSVGGVNYADLGEGDNLSVQLGGVNYVNTGAGDDIAVSAGGLSIQRLGDGDNVAVAVGGVNTTFTGSGEDIIVQGGGINVAFSGAGDDIVVAAGAGNLLDAGAGDDIIVSAGLANVQFGGAGDDVMVGLGQANVMMGDASLDMDDIKAGFVLKSQASDGEDIMVGGGQLNVMIGGGNNDVMVGGGQLNVMVGDALLGGDYDGNDIMVGGGQLNIMAGGGREDLVIGGGQMNIILGDGLASAVQDMIGSLDNFLGTAGFEALFGSQLSGMLGEMQAVVEEKKNDIDAAIAGVKAQSDALQVYVNNAIDSVTGDIQAEIDKAQAAVNYQLDALNPAPEGTTNPAEDAEGLIEDANGAVDGVQEDIDRVAEDVKNRVNETIERTEEKITEAMLAALDSGGQFLADLLGGTQFDGDDYLVGGGQHNIMIGGGGDDVMIGGGQNNFMLGGAGHDAMIGGGENNMMSGDAGNDYMLGGGRNNRMFGGAGLDFMIGGGQQNFMDAGSGSDVVIGGGVDNTINAGSGNDIVIGGGQNVILDAGEGDDVLLGGGQNTTVTGGAGDDLLLVGGQNNMLDAGEGDDIAVVGGADNALVGGAGADLLIAGGQSVVVDGGADDDVVIAAGQNAFASGGTGDDLVIGAGQNVVLDGGAGADLLFAAGASTTVLGRAGDDIAIAAGAGGVLDGGAGNDAFIVAGTEYQVSGGTGDDLVVATGTKNQLLGGAGNDFMVGIGSDNSFLGGANDDTILTMDDAAIASGGDGADTVRGFGWGIIGTVLSGELTAKFEPVIDVVQDKISVVFDSIDDTISMVTSKLTDALDTLMARISAFDFSRLNPLNYDPETGLTPVSEKVANAVDAAEDAEHAAGDAAAGADSAQDSADQAHADANDSKASADNQKTSADGQIADAEDEGDAAQDGETNGSFSGDAADKQADLEAGKAEQAAAEAEAQAGHGGTSDVEDEAAAYESDAAQKQQEAQTELDKKAQAGPEANDFLGDVAAKAGGLLDQLSSITSQLAALDVVGKLEEGIGTDLPIDNPFDIPTDHLSTAMDLITQARSALDQLSNIETILGDLGLDAIRDTLQDLAGDAVDPLYGAIMSELGDVFGEIHDTLTGDAGNDTLEGGFGNDTLIGGAGDDHYIYQVGDGDDVIRENGSGNDMIEITTQNLFGLDLGKVDLDDLTFEKTDGNLIIRLASGLGGSITIEDMEGAGKVETLRLRDGDDFTDYTLDELYAQATDLDFEAWQDQYVAFLEVIAEQDAGDVALMSSEQHVTFLSQVEALVNGTQEVYFAQLDLVDEHGPLLASADTGGDGQTASDATDPDFHDNAPSSSTTAERDTFASLKEELLAVLADESILAQAQSKDGSDIVAVDKKKMDALLKELHAITGQPVDEIGEILFNGPIGADAIKKALSEGASDLSGEVSAEFGEDSGLAVDLMSQALVSALGGMISKHHEAVVDAATKPGSDAVKLFEEAALAEAQALFDLSHDEFVALLKTSGAIINGDLSSVEGVAKTGAALSEGFAAFDPGGAFGKLQLQDWFKRGEIVNKAFTDIAALDDKYSDLGIAGMSSLQSIETYNQLADLANGLKSVGAGGKGAKKAPIPEHILSNSDTVAKIADLKDGIDVVVLYGDHAADAGNAFLGYLTNPSDLVAKDFDPSDLPELAGSVAAAVKGGKGNAALIALEVVDQYVDAAKYSVMTRAEAEAKGLMKFAVSEQEVARVMSFHTPLSLSPAHMLKALGEMFEGTLSLESLPPELASKIFAMDANANALSEALAQADESLIMLERSVENGPINGGIEALQGLPADAIIGGDLGGNIVIDGVSKVATRQFFFVKAKYLREVEEIIENNYLGWDIIDHDDVGELAQNEFKDIIGDQASEFAEKFTDNAVGVNAEIEIISENNTFFFILDGGPAGPLAEEALDQLFDNHTGDPNQIYFTEAGDFISGGRQYRMVRAHVLDPALAGLDLDGSQTIADIQLSITQALTQSPDDTTDQVAPQLADSVTQAIGKLHELLSTHLAHIAPGALHEAEGQGLVGVASKDVISDILNGLLASGQIDQQMADEIGLKLLDHQSDAFANANQALLEAHGTGTKVMVMTADAHEKLGLTDADTITPLLDPETGELVYVVKAASIHELGLSAEGILPDEKAADVLEDATGQALNGLAGDLLATLAEDLDTLKRIVLNPGDRPLAFVEVENDNFTDAALGDFVEIDLGGFRFDGRSFRVMQLKADSELDADLLSPLFLDALAASGGSLVDGQDMQDLLVGLAQTAYLNEAQARLIAAKLLPEQNPFMTTLAQDLNDADGVGSLVAIKAAHLGDLSQLPDGIVHAIIGNREGIAETETMKRTYRADVPKGFFDAFDTDHPNALFNQRFDYEFEGTTYQVWIDGGGVPRAQHVFEWTKLVDLDLKANGFVLMDRDTALSLGLRDKIESGHLLDTLLKESLSYSAYDAVAEKVSYAADNIAQLASLADFGADGVTMHLIELDGTAGILSDFADGGFTDNNIADQDLLTTGKTLGEFILGDKRYGVWIDFDDGAPLHPALTSLKVSPGELSGLLAEVLVQAGDTSPLSDAGLEHLFGVSEWAGADDYVDDMTAMLALDDIVVVQADVLGLEGSMGANASALQTGDEANIHFASYVTLEGARVYVINKASLDAGKVEFFEGTQAYPAARFLQDMKALLAGGVDLDTLASKVQGPDQAALDAYDAINAAGEDGVMIVASAMAKTLDAGDVLTTFSLDGQTYAVVDSVAGAVNQTVSNAVLDQAEVDALLSQLNLPARLNDEIVTAEEKAPLSDPSEMLSFFKAMLDMDVAEGAAFNLSMISDKVLFEANAGSDVEFRFLDTTKPFFKYSDLLEFDGSQDAGFFDDPTFLKLGFEGMAEMNDYITRQGHFAVDGNGTQLHKLSIGNAEFVAMSLFADEMGAGATLLDKLQDGEVLSAKLIEIAVKDLHAAGSLTEEEMFTLFARLNFKQSASAQSAIEAVLQDGSDIILIDYDTHAQFDLGNLAGAVMHGVLQNAEGAPVIAMSASSLMKAGATDVLVSVADSHATRETLEFLADSYLRNMIGANPVQSNKLLGDITAPDVGKFAEMFVGLASILSGGPLDHAFVAVKAGAEGALASLVDGGLAEKVGVDSFGTTAFYSVSSGSIDSIPSSAFASGDVLGALLGDLVMGGFLTELQAQKIGARFQVSQNPFGADIANALANAADGSVVILHGVTDDIPDEALLGVISGDMETIGILPDAVFQIVSRDYVEANWNDLRDYIVSHPTAVQVLEDAGYPANQNVLHDVSSDAAAIFADMSHMDVLGTFGTSPMPYAIVKTEAMEGTQAALSNLSRVDVVVGGQAITILQGNLVGGIDGFGDIIAQNFAASDFLNEQQIRTMLNGLNDSRIDVNMIVAQAYQPGGVYDLDQNIDRMVTADSPLIAIDLAALLESPLAESESVISDLTNVSTSSWSRGIVSPQSLLVDRDAFIAMLAEANQSLGADQQIGLYDLLASTEFLQVPPQVHDMVADAQNGDLVELLEGTSARFIGVLLEDLQIPLASLVQAGMVLGAMDRADGGRMVILRNEAVRRGMVENPAGWTADGYGLLQELVAVGADPALIQRVEADLVHAKQLFNNRGAKVIDFFGDLDAFIGEAGESDSIVLIRKSKLDAYGIEPGTGDQVSDQFLVDPDDSSVKFVALKKSYAASLGLIPLVAGAEEAQEVFNDHGFNLPPEVEVILPQPVGDLLNQLTAELAANPENDQLIFAKIGAVLDGEVTPGSGVTIFGPADAVGWLAPAGSVPADAMADVREVAKLVAQLDGTLAELQELAQLVPTSQNFLTEGYGAFAARYAHETDQEVYFLEGFVFPGTEGMSDAAVLGYLPATDTSGSVTIVLSKFFEDGWNPQMGYSGVVSAEQLVERYGSLLPDGLLDRISTEHDDLIEDNQPAFSGLSSDIDDAAALLDAETNQALDASGASGLASDDATAVLIDDGVPSDPAEDQFAA
ncbi:hypothetical protein [Epibacterium sp. Ofav1-8]|uniref:hypothetical protein n=1 Tax=Epibacterium sp. Ofav1-8 TaxID=2917735 RepID=UPI001EF73F8D|nr:hypothetical protein [Epibacterium sp. Ofav1-8]MCG7626097.1 hypothetical protein [Epibacterium sp. Ofav1-8]